MTRIRWFPARPPAVPLRAVVAVGRPAPPEPPALPPPGACTSHTAATCSWPRSVPAAPIAGQSLSSAGGQDVYLAKLSSDGTGLWAQGFGDGDEQLGTSLAVGSDRFIALTGGYAGVVDLGGGALPSQSAQGAFIARFAQ